jgi:hypothetical protein
VPGHFKASTLILWFCALLPASPALAEGVTFGPNDVRSVFYVSKSENQNQVHYGLRVDASCRPLKDTPVFAYWRRLKKNVRVDEPLVGPGRRVYGASEEQQVSTSPTGFRIRMHVRATSKVAIEIHVKRRATGGCEAIPYAVIQGETARLSYAFLQLARFGLGVKYVELVGYRSRDGARVSEQIR